MSLGDALARHAAKRIFRLVAVSLAIGAILGAVVVSLWLWLS